MMCSCSNGYLCDKWNQQVQSFEFKFHPSTSHYSSWKMNKSILFFSVNGKIVRQIHQYTFAYFIKSEQIFFFKSLLREAEKFSASPKSWQHFFFNFLSLIHFFIFCAFQSFGKISLACKVYMQVVFAPTNIVKNW